MIQEIMRDTAFLSQKEDVHFYARGYSKFHVEPRPIA